jgi:DNA-binding MarR family transcriptional regulator
VLERLERELTLVARHQVMARRDQVGGRLEKSAYLLLTRIDADGAMSIGQLAEAFALDTSTVNRQTAALLRAGLAERVADPDGGMARKLRITGTGKDRLAADRAFHIEGLGRVLAEWTPGEIEQFEDVLTRFNRSIEALEGREWPRPESGGAGGA